MKYFFARQPVFDDALGVYAYEIVFRSGFEGALPDAESISSSFLNLGLDTLAGDRKACVDFPTALILKEVPLLFPANRLVVGVPAGTDWSDELETALSRLKSRGYSILFDDAVLDGPHDPRVVFADIVRIDFAESTPAERSAWLRDKGEGTRLLARNVESMPIYREALELGFSLFQGFFFAMPEVVSGNDVPGFKVNYLRLMREAQSADFDLKKIAEIIKRDVSLSYRLMRFINSSAFGWAKRIESVHHALVLLGQREFRRWLSLVSMGGMITERPSEILVQSVIRARFCELMAPKVGLTERELDLYMLGMFSSLDAVLEQEMDRVASEVGLVDDVRSALEGSPGVLRDLLDLVLAYERGERSRLPGLANELGVDENDLPEQYQDAIVWASEAFFE